MYLNVEQIRRMLQGVSVEGVIGIVRVKYSV